MEIQSDTNSAQRVTLQQTVSGISDTTSTRFQIYSENPGLHSCLNLHQYKSTKSTLPPLPPSRAHAKPRSLLLGSESRSLAFDEELKHEVAHGRGKDNPDIDMGKLKRKLTNKVAAQTSRLKTKKYVRDLQMEVVKFQDTITVLTTRLRIEKENNKFLLLESDLLQKEVERTMNEHKLREQRRESLESEMQMLKLQNAEPGYVQNPNSGPQSDFRLLGQPYPSLSFYRERLQTVQINSALENVLSDEVISGLLGEQQPTEPTAEGIQEIDEDYIQQFNYEEVNLDEITFV